MQKKVSFGRVSVRDLSRKPGEVLRRVELGERLLLCSYGRPVATLQPLDGCVVQPFEGAEFDVYGSPLGDASEEASKLEEIEKEMLIAGQKLDRFHPGRIRPHWRGGQVSAAVASLKERGLLRKTPRGLRLTGRGWLMREALAPEDPFAEDAWFRPPEERL
jgi:prevent-host-death family protein